MNQQTTMTIHLFDKANGEIKTTFTQSFVPWKLLKSAVKIAKSLNPKDMKEEDVEQLTGLVVATFGDKFSVEDLNEGADMTEIMAVLQQIISRANGSIADPTQPG